MCYLTARSGVIKRCFTAEAEIQANAWKLDHSKPLKQAYYSIANWLHDTHGIRYCII